MHLSFLYNRPATEKLIAITLVTLGLFFSYANYFIQDDAYISFVYARNFANGYGPVWYPGSNEYGYSNFLYVILIGIGLFLGGNAEAVSAAINISAYLLCILIFCRAASYYMSPLAVLLAGVVLVTHHSFSAYASSGLETMLFTALVMYFYHALLNIKQSIWVLAGISSAAILVRPDTGLLLIPGYIYLALTLFMSEGFTAKFVRILLPMAVMPACAIAGWVGFAYLQYGHMLPTTFDIKFPDSTGMVATGLRYLQIYAGQQYYIFNVQLALILSLAGYAIYNYRSPQMYKLATLMGVVTVWLCYVVFIGGDFMEFRQLVPIIPFIILVTFALIAVCFQSQEIQQKILCLVAVVLVFANFMHAKNFRSNTDDYVLADKYIESTDGLYKWMNRPGINWRHMGAVLGELFYTGNPDDVKISLGPVGAMTYYSRLHVVDMLGINTRAVLKNYQATKERRPGHLAIATTVLLQKSKVNLNIFHPQTLCKTDKGYTLTKNVVHFFPFRRNETLLIPVTSECYLVADYMGKHPQVDALIKSRAILRYREVAHSISCPRWLCL